MAERTAKAKSQYGMPPQVKRLFDIDSLMQRVMSVGLHGQSLTASVTVQDILCLCSAAKDIFMKQPVLLEIDSPVTICGDTHGQYADLLRLFSIGGYPPETNYLFLGDYVDRGKQSLETILLLFCYKVYGFYEECQRRYSVAVWNLFNEVFAWMPFVAIVGGRIMCMHGGISPPTSDDQLKQIKRPTDPPQGTFMMDLLWADPEQHVHRYRPNTRGVSVVFGVDAVLEFCERFNIDLICRAHQVVQDGYEFFARRHLVTIFSAPHYCGEFDNAAGMMVVSADLMCSFRVVRASHRKTIAVRGEMQGVK